MSKKISFRAYSSMMNIITRSLNIVTILTKTKIKNKFLSKKLYIRLTHARSHFQSKYSKRSC